MKCGYESCIPSIKDMDSELVTCFIILYISPWIYYIIGIYFYEV